MVAILRSQDAQTILGSAPLRIGSAPGNQLVLNDVSVEPYHAELRPSGDGYIIVNLSRSSNTFINRQRLYPNVPQMLQNGNQVQIGNVQLTYEVTSSPPVPPTVPSPGSSRDAGQSSNALPFEKHTPLPLAYTPTFVGSKSDPPSAPPPPFIAGRMSNMPAFDPYQPPRRKRSKVVWIVVGCIGLLVLSPFLLLIFGGILAFFVAGMQPTTTPTQALQAYCSTVKAHDTRTAYNMYSSDVQKQDSFLQTQQLVALATDCTVSNVNDTKENGTWKLKTSSTPTSTLDDYCSALKQKDYRTAYNLFSSAVMAQETESQFASTFSKSTTTDCSVSRSDDTAGTGSISYTYSDGSKMTADYALVQENGTWKIQSEKVL